jgi:Ca2+-binding EF-hand superfamily protein
VSEGQVTDLFLAMDTDGNGNVNLTELSTSEARFEKLCNLLESLDESEYFKQADKDDDGVVSLLEQAAALGEL